MSGSTSEKIGCGTVLIFLVVVIIFLGALGSSITGVGK
jgi:hypothetical protein